MNNWGAWLATALWVTVVILASRRPVRRGYESSGPPVTSSDLQAVSGRPAAGAHATPCGLPSMDIEPPWASPCPHDAPPQDFDG